jgi:multicomponent Na+:H+ antiporter subunit F
MVAGFTIAAGILLLILAIGLIIVFRMKDRADRIMATQFLATVSVGWLLLVGQVSGKTYLFDVALLFALLATLTTVAFVHYKSDETEGGDDANRT